MVINCDTCANEKDCLRLATSRLMDNDDTYYRVLVSMYGCHVYKEKESKNGC